MWIQVNRQLRGNTAEKYYWIAKLFHEGALTNEAIKEADKQSTSIHGLHVPKGFDVIKRNRQTIINIRKGNRQKIY